MTQTQQVRGTATNVYSDNEHTIVVYHKTAVVKFNDKEILLDTGGWFTRTTKMRMNQASYQYNLGYSVFAKDKQWYVRYNGVDTVFNNGYGKHHITRV